MVFLGPVGTPFTFFCFPWSFVWRTLWYHRQLQPQLWWSFTSSCWQSWHTPQCFNLLFICAIDSALLRFAHHRRYGATADICHGRSRPGISIHLLCLQNRTYISHSWRYFSTVFGSSPVPIRMHVLSPVYRINERLVGNYYCTPIPLTLTLIPIGPICSDILFPRVCVWYLGCFTILSLTIRHHNKYTSSRDHLFWQHNSSPSLSSTSRLRALTSIGTWGISPLFRLDVVRSTQYLLSLASFPFVFSMSLSCSCGVRVFPMQWYSLRHERIIHVRVTIDVYAAVGVAHTHSSHGGRGYLPPDRVCEINCLNPPFFIFSPLIYE